MLYHFHNVGNTLAPHAYNSALSNKIIIMQKGCTREGIKLNPAAIDTGGGGRAVDGRAMNYDVGFSLNEFGLTFLQHPLQLDLEITTVPLASPASGISKGLEADNIWIAFSSCFYTTFSCLTNKAAD